MVRVDGRLDGPAAIGGDGGIQAWDVVVGFAACILCAEGPGRLIGADCTGGIHPCNANDGVQEPLLGGDKASNCLFAAVACLLLSTDIASLVPHKHFCACSTCVHPVVWGRG